MKQHDDFASSLDVDSYNSSTNSSACMVPADRIDPPVFCLSVLALAII